jgi:hypothetical protein
MTKIKLDPRVYTKPAPEPAPAPEPVKEKPVAKETAPKAASNSKATGPKRRKA